MMLIFCFLLSFIMAAQSTHPIKGGAWTRLLDYLLGLMSYAYGLGFSMRLLDMVGASTNMHLMIIFSTIPPVAGICLGCWADKQLKSASSDQPAEIASATTSGN